jgi:hypothetical protein
LVDLFNKARQKGQHALKWKKLTLWNVTFNGIFKVELPRGAAYLLLLTTR